MTVLNENRCTGFCVVVLSLAGDVVILNGVLVGATVVAGNF